VAGPSTAACRPADRHCRPLASNALLVLLLVLLVLLLWFATPAAAPAAAFAAAPEQAGTQLPQQGCRVAQRFLHVVVILQGREGGWEGGGRADVQAGGRADMRLPRV
jgi:hypothetical protein